MRLWPQHWKIRNNGLYVLLLSMKRSLTFVFILSNLFFASTVIGGLIFRFRSRDLPPSIVNDHFSEGNFLASQGRFQEASEEFRSYAALIPQDYRGFAALGDVLSRNEEWQDAIYFFQRALEINPNSAQVHYLLGVAYWGAMQLKNQVEVPGEYISKGRRHLREARRLGYPVDPSVMVKMGLKNQ